MGRDYSDGPHAPGSKKSDKLPAIKQDASLGFTGDVPKMVPNVTKPGKPPIGGGAHGYKGTHPKGKVRVSGHSGAHHIGLKK